MLPCLRAQTLLPTLPEPLCPRAGEWGSWEGEDGEGRKGQNRGERGQRGPAPGGKEKPGRRMSQQGQEAALDQRPLGLNTCSVSLDLSLPLWA